MPIYAYRCAACGHAQDVLRKISDPVLVDCPACGAASFEKQLTAAGFQLKGSGWYATDFRNGGTAPAKPAESDAAPAAAEKSNDKSADKSGKPAGTDGPAKPAAAAAAASAGAAAPAAASSGSAAGGCGGSCACH